MKSHLRLLVMFIILVLSSCEKEDLNVSIHPDETLFFSGTFDIISSDNITGTVILNISNGYYECITNRPYGNSAGIIETTTTTLNFIDTLFTPIPALYGPTYILSGEHSYNFDGENLKIWKNLNVGSIKYEVKIEN